MKLFPSYGFFIGLLLLSHSLLAQYSGGIGGGYAMAELIQFENPVIPNNPQVLYKGGNGGGHASAVLLLDTNTVVPDNPQRLYIGGVGGGFASSAFLLDTVEVVVQNPQKLYLGGNGGGHSLGIYLLDTVEAIIQNPQKLYLGGIGGGYAMGQTYTDTVIAIAQNPQKLYLGGIGGGHDMDTLVLATVLKDCIKPMAPSTSSYQICSGQPLPDTWATPLAGHFLRWYATSQGGIATLKQPVLDTKVPGVYKFYVTNVNDLTNCESDRAVITITVNAKPAAPVVSNVVYCQGATSSALTATALSGHNLKWYSDATTATALASAPVPSTTQSGTITYYVSQVNTATGCESDRAAITITVNAKPAAPVVSNVVYCQGATSSALTATALSGHSLKWYANATTSTALASAPIPSTSQSGTITYYVSQINAATGCESDRAAITVTINAKPAAPVVSNVLYCQGATSSALTATALSGHSLKWYSDTTTATALSSAPVPSTTQSGTITYYVSQINTATGCESDRAAITVIVNAKPASPVVSNLGYCQGVTSSALTATALSGHNLKWYADATTATALASAPVPSTAQTGTITYYVSQINTATGCESDRAAITVTVNAKPTAPVVSNVGYCQGATSTALTATALSGHSLKWYSDVTTTTALASAPIPSTAQSGTLSYYVSQVNTATGCESDRAVITVTVNVKPIAPTVSSLSYCQGATATALNASASTGHTLRWYATASAVTPLPSAPVPSTSQSGKITYYVSQVNTATGCESDRAAITVTVNAKPAAPVVSNVGYCQGATSSALTATALSGHNLKWYSDATTATALSSAPVPSTAQSGTIAYYVSQVNTATGCESDRAVITVTINAKPASPVVSNVGYCQGATSTALTATALSGHHLKWYSDATTSTALSSAPLPSTAKTGLISFYVSQENVQTGCVSARSRLDVLVSPVPQPPIITKDPSGALLSSEIIGIQWQKDGQLISGATTAIFKPTESGYYAVKTVQNGCSALSSAYYYLVTALVDLPEGKYVNMFPNPVKSRLKIEHNLGNIGNRNYLIFDQNGKLVHKTTNRFSAFSIDLSGLVNGKYQLVIVSMEGLPVYSGQFIKL